MEHITLDEYQISVLTRARDLVGVEDDQGKLRGFITMVIGSDQLADAKRALASQEAHYSTAQVLAKLYARGAP